MDKGIEFNSYQIEIQGDVYLKVFVQNLYEVCRKGHCEPCYLWKTSEELIQHLYNEIVDIGEKGDVELNILHRVYVNTSYEIRTNVIKINRDILLSSSIKVTECKINKYWFSDEDVELSKDSVYWDNESAINYNFTLKSQVKNTLIFINSTQ